MQELLPSRNRQEKERELSVLLFSLDQPDATISVPKLCHWLGLAQKAVVVTGDPEFKKLEDEYSIQWLKTKSS